VLIVPVEEALHSGPGAADEVGNGDDTVDAKESDDHALLDIAQLSSFSVDFLFVFWDLQHLRLQLPPGLLRCVDHDV